MKAALISFHNVYNYGACLQAYALQQAVINMGVDCEYIDYVNKQLADVYKIHVRIAKAIKVKDVKGALKNLLGAPLAWSRIRKFNQFFAENIKTTKTKYYSSNEAAVLNDKYDKFIIGSDQVWNDKHNGGDPAFFLDFVKDNEKKISYASSFGVTEIPQCDQNRFSTLLNSIGCLSTREKKGVDLIEHLTGRHAHLVLDPVFLIDMVQWKNMIPKNKSSERYTFYYMNARFNLNDFGRVTKWKDHKKHILSSSIGFKEFIKKNQKITFSMSPEAFLREINNAELIVTTSFHCLAFSIILHKPFVAILSGDEGRDERLCNLLQITGLENRIFSRNMTLEDVQKPIDYKEVERKLLNYRNYSKQFLYSALFENKQIVDAIIEPSYIEPKSIKQSICDENKCTGCGACYIKCPQQAIKMNADQDGFLAPVIDENKCIHCNICKSVCQVNKEKIVPKSQKYYAFKNIDAVREKSSSGGAFSAIAEQVISEGGIVVASEMNSNWNVEHSVARTMDEVKKQACTYYVQGKSYNEFKNVKSELNAGKKVFFTGTPCQVAGLKRYLGREYENLITCDLICHGIPSPEMFKIYINYLQGKGEVSSLQHRDKRIGWKGYNVSAVINGKMYRNSGWLKAYVVMFSHGLINRNSCYYCPYSSYNRPGDITIGDYWGIEKYHKNLKDKLGVSLILTNNNKGEMYLKKSIKKGYFIFPVKKEETVQPSLKNPMEVPMQRLACIMEMKKSYEKAAKIYGEWNIKGKVKECIRSIVK